MRRRDFDFPAEKLVLQEDSPPISVIRAAYHGEEQRRVLEVGLRLLRLVCARTHKGRQCSRAD